MEEALARSKAALRDRGLTPAGDPRFDSMLASKFINCLMWDGKKTVAQRVFYDALEEIKKRVPEQESIDVFTEAIENK